MSEQLKVFNKDYQEIGFASRDEIHRKGLWHETFHCWIYTFIDGRLYLFMQHRALSKKNFPNKLDISAAGHLEKSESVSDGVREVEEELGIQMSVDAMLSLGVITVDYEVENTIDREFTNVFLYDGSHLEFTEFSLQEEEVQGMYCCDYFELKKLLAEEDSEMAVHGFEVRDGTAHEKSMIIHKKDICANSSSYYTYLFERIEKKLASQGIFD